MNEEQQPASEFSPEFSYVIDLEKAGSKGKSWRLIASEEERAAIAARLKIPAVKKLEGEIRVTATRREIIIEGAIAAHLIRECVASLEPMDEEIAEAFDLALLRHAPEMQPPEEGENWEEPEVHEGAELDIGEVLVQQLSLAMDPWPRKEGAQSLAEAYGEKDRISPFAGLKEALKKSDKNQ